MTRFSATRRDRLKSISGWFRARWAAARHFDQRHDGRADLRRPPLVVVLLQTHDNVLADSARDADALVGRDSARGNLQHPDPVLDGAFGAVLIDDLRVALVAFVRQFQDAPELGALLLLEALVQLALVDGRDQPVLPVRVLDDELVEVHVGAELGIPELRIFDPVRQLLGLRVVRVFRSSRKALRLQQRRVYAGVLQRPAAPGPRALILVLVLVLILVAPAKTTHGSPPATLRMVGGTTLVADSACRAPLR